MRTTEAHSYGLIYKPAYNWQPNDWYCPPDCARQELQNLIFKETGAFLADNGLVNPLFISFSKMPNLENKGLIQINYKVLHNHHATSSSRRQCSEIEIQNQNQKVRFLPRVHWTPSLEPKRRWYVENRSTRNTVMPGNGKILPPEKPWHPIANT